MFSKMKKEFQVHAETMIAEQNHLFVTNAELKEMLDDM